MMNETVLTHMAKAFFACAWADQQEENGVSFSGVDIMDVMPVVIDPAAIKAAKELYESIELANGLSIDNILEKVDIDAETFGHYAAMDSMGHGVGLGDYGVDWVVVPYRYFCDLDLEKDYA